MNIVFFQDFERQLVPFEKKLHKIKEQAKRSVLQFDSQLKSDSSSFRFKHFFHTLHVV